MKASTLPEIELTPTPIPALNELLGGGIPTRVICEVAGPAGSGKSSAVLQFIGQAQRLGKKTYYADAERAQDFVKFATDMGVDCSQLEYDKADTAEILLDNLIEWAEKNKNSVLCVDAIGALHGREESEKGMDGRTIGIQSRMIALFCRKLAPIIDKNNHTLLMINHIYTDPSTGRIRSSGGAKLAYATGLSIWLKEAFGKPAKRSTDGTKTLKYIEVEIKSKAKYSGAFEGKKTILEFIPKKGFVGEFVAAPTPKKRGRPTKSTTTVVGEKI